MRRYETKPVEIQQREVLVETICDLCGVVAKGSNWETSSYETAESEIEVKVRCKTGFDCPEGGNGDEIIVDICPKCFKEKLVPFLKSQGADIKTINYYW